MFKLSDRTKRDISLWFKILGVLLLIIGIMAAFVTCLVLAPIWISGIVVLLAITTCLFLISKDISG